MFGTLVLRPLHEQLSRTKSAKIKKEKFATRLQWTLLGSVGKSEFASKANAKCSAVGSLKWVTFGLRDRGNARQVSVQIRAIKPTQVGFAVSTQAVTTMQTIRCEGAKRSTRESRFLIVQRLPIAPDPPIAPGPRWC